MFCDGCGASLQVDQVFCGRCGKEVKSGIRFAAPRPSRVQEHVRLLGILWLGLSALNFVGAGVLLVMARVFMRHIGTDFPAPPNFPAGFLHSLFSVIGTFTLIKAIAGFAAGWGLLQREPWARILALVLAFLALFNIPFGTALGVYTLWVLLPTQSEREYEEQARAA